MPRILIEKSENKGYLRTISNIDNGLKSLFQVLFVFIRLFETFVMNLSGGQVFSNMEQ